MRKTKEMIQLTLQFFSLFFLSYSSLLASEGTIATISILHNSTLYNQCMDKQGNQIPLMRAINEVDCNRVKSLLKQGTSPNIENYCGEVPLHLAMEWDTERRLYPQRKISSDIIKLLLQYRADPNTRYRFKNATPLHAAVFHNSFDIVSELLKCGAEKNVCDDRGYTPLTLAKLYQFKDIIFLLSDDMHIIPTQQNAPPAEHILTSSQSNVEETPIIKQLQPYFFSKKIIDNYLEQVEDDIS
jgi:ankyrin repeat protein